MSVVLEQSVGLGDGVHMIATFTEMDANPIARVSSIAVTLTLKNTGKDKATYDSLTNTGILNCSINGQTVLSVNGTSANYSLKAGATVSKGVGGAQYTHPGDDSTPPSVSIGIAVKYPGGNHNVKNATLPLTTLRPAPGPVGGCSAHVQPVKVIGGQTIIPMSLSWALSGGGPAASFNIFRGTDPSNLAQIATVSGGTAGSFIDQSMPITYTNVYSDSLAGYGPIYYRVDALSPAGTSTGPVFEADLPSPPVKNPTLTTNAQGKPVIGWTVTSPYAADAAVKYQVTRYAQKQNGSVWNTVVDATYTVAGAASGSTITYTDTAAATGVLYEWTIGTVDTAGKGRDSVVPTFASYNVDRQSVLGLAPSAPNLSIQERPNPTVITTGVSHLTLQADEGSLTHSWVASSIPVTLIGRGIEPISFTAQYSKDNASWSALPLSNVSTTPAATLFSQVVSCTVDLTGIANAGDTIWLRFAALTVTEAGTKQSNWTVTNALTVVAPPVPTITDPVNGSSIGESDPVISWNFYSPNGATQTSASLTFDPQDGTQPLAFTIPGPQTQFKLPVGSLLNGHTYQVTLDVYDSLGLTSLDTDPSVVTYSVKYLPPAPPVLNAVFDAPSATVTVTLTGADAVSGIYDATATLDLYRQELDGTWTKVVSEAVPGDTYVDVLVPIGATVNYQAVASTEDHLTTYGPIVPVTVPRPEWFYFSYYDAQGFLHTLRAHGDLVLTRKPAFVASTFQVAGRGLPVPMWGDNKTEEVDVSAALDFAIANLDGSSTCVNTDTLSSPDSAFYDMFTSSPLICFRGVNVDGTSVKVWGLLTSNSIGSSYPENTSQGVGFATLSITMQRVDFDESVTAN